MWRKIIVWSLFSFIGLQLTAVMVQAQSHDELTTMQTATNTEATLLTSTVAITAPLTSTVTAKPLNLTERWIYVDLSDQTLTAYEGIHPVFSTYVSTGLPQYPTVEGEFQVYVKYEATRMTGGYGADFYDLANVPHTMYFYGGYGLHGAYWHNNFGTPMSHGCVNLSLPDAEWVFDWASVGTWVVIRE